ncbi:MAG: ABC transporter substrate-binding protein [Chloroflexota bacterium]|nr:ABC transporter substrate-binding protein [Chloroflexota bacterium]
MRTSKLILISVAAMLTLALAACGSDTKKDPTAASGAPTSAGGTAAAPTDIPTSSGPVTLHLGYYPNFTHAPAIVGLARGTFQQDLGPNVTIDTKTFNAGGDEITALFAGDIDIGYIGPSPAVNGYVKSKGADVRIIAGAVSGGASLIVRDGAGINTAADFANKKVATPQLGNTQDVALRKWLKDNNLAAKEQGGNVTVIPTDNATTLTAMQQGNIDAAWVPEPWDTRLIQEAGGKLFLDEKDLWPNGQFSTTMVIARTDFLNKHPDVVLNFLRAHIETTQWIAANPEDAKKLVNDGIQQLTSKALKQATIDEAWKHIGVTEDPLAAAVLTASENAFSLGFLGASKPDLSKLFALDLLNKALKEKNLPAVKAN